MQPLFEQLLHQRGELAFIAIILALQARERGAEHPGVVVGHIGRGDEQAHQLSVLVDHQMQIEAEEPAGGGAAAGGHLLKDPVGVYAAVVADSQLFGVDVVVTRELIEAGPVMGQEEGVQEGLTREIKKVVI